MPTVITKTVGPGGDYSDMADAADEVGNIADAEFGSRDLVSSDGAIVFEVAASVYDQRIRFQSNQNITADATRNVTFKADASSRHSGDAHSGVILTNSSNVIECSIPFTVFDGFILRSGISLLAESCIVKNCISKSFSRDAYAIAADNCVLENNWIEGSTRGVSTSSMSSGETITLRNCTFHGVSQGVRGDGGVNLVLYNCFASNGSLVSLSFSSEAYFDGSGNVSVETNLNSGVYSNSTFPPNDGLFLGGQPWVLSTDINAVSTGNTAVYDPYTSKLYNVDGNDAWGALTDLSEAPSEGIEGTTRSVAGFNPGAQEEDAADADLPRLVYAPSPSNGAEDVGLSLTALAWEIQDGELGSSEVFFGESPTLTQANLVSTSNSPAAVSINLEPSTDYFWRVDRTNGAGTTQGITFTFTSEALPDTGQAGEGESSGSSSGKPTEYSLIGDLKFGEVTSRSRRWDTREGDIRERIFKMSQAQHNISFIYKDSLRSMIASFNDIITIDDENKIKDVKVYHANAERAIAKIAQENNIVLPIITVSQTVSQDDSERRRYESVLVHEKYWDAEESRAKRIVSLAPTAVTINYQVNIWCKYMSDMDQIIEQIRLKFNPEMNVPTQQSTIAKAMLGGEDDIGSPIAQDKQDRLLQKAFAVSLRTYVENPKFLLTNTGEIEKFVIDTDA